MKTLSYFLCVSLFLIDGSIFAFAKKTTPLIPDSIEGKVTLNEISLFDDYYLNYKIPLNNNDKKMSWNLAPYMHSLLFMYEITNDIKYINQAIKCADIILKAKRVNELDYVTKRIIPGWGFFNKQFTKKGGHPVLYNNVVGNATVMRALTRLAILIQQQNLPAEYQNKALKYIKSSIETVNSFISTDDWFDDKSNLFHFPKHKRHDEVLFGVRGIKSAHNRQLLMASAMLYIVQYQKSTQENLIEVKKYNTIIDNVASFFWRNVKVHNMNNKPYLSWYYREQGKLHKNGNKIKRPKIEDIGHGGYDIKALVHIFQQRKIGSAAHMQALASTLIDKTQIDKENHQFSYGIDGSKANKSPADQQRHSIRWLALSDWDKRVYENAGWLLQHKVKKPKGLPYAEFLYYKAKFYGIATLDTP